MKPEPPRQTRRSGRSLAAAIPPFAVLIALIAALAIKSQPPEPGVPLSVESVTGWTPPESAGPPDLRLAPPSSARPIEPGEDDRSRALGETLRNALERHATPAAGDTPPSPTLPRASARADLAHRGAPLTQAQTAALARLRWQVPGKHVEWRTAAEKPVITYLEAARLEPAAEAAEPGRSLAETTAARFLRSNAGLFGAGDPDSAWRLRQENRDILGYTHTRFAQYWQDLEVWPGGVTVQTAPGGDVTLVTAAYAPEPKIDTRPAISAAEARAAALRAAGLLVPSAAGEPTLLVHAPLESEARLAWRLVVGHEGFMRTEFFIDARDGGVLESLPLVVSTAATGSGIDLNGQNRQINLWLDTDNRYYTFDASKHMFNPAAPFGTGVIAVLDIQNSPTIDTSKVVSISSASPNGPWNPHAVSASVNLGRVYDYYFHRFNRNSVDGNGGTMIGIVNLDDDNAYSMNESLMMIFGNRKNYAEALDVVGHEMTHSVISTTSKLVYRFQSGALNESFADILGEGCEAHFNGGVPDWQMGTQLGQAMRSMSRPSSIIAFGSTPYPEKMSQFINLPAEADQGGVHINSSIVNHCFYQLAVGLPGAIGIDDALQIFYRAVTTKLNPNSQFIDARLACVQSARELFGNGSPQALRTAAAFDFVEILDQQPTPAPTPTPSVEAMDSTLFIFPSNGFTWLGRREALFSDDAAGVFLGPGPGQPTQVMPGKKPAVRGDGAFGVYVTPGADGAFINTQTGTSTFFGFTGQIHSAAISANGNVQAYVLSDGAGNPDNRIYVFDQVSGQTETYTVTQPLTDKSGGATSATVLFVDALDISTDGRFIFYDALNRLTLPGGISTQNWSISFIDREAGSIQSLIPPILGVNMGNPSFGQTRPELVTFDVVEASGVAHIYVANLANGTLKPLATLAEGISVAPGWPGYSGDDAAVVYTNYSFNGFFWTPYLESQPVQSDGVTANGNPFAWLAGSSPHIGLIYRRGVWEAPPELNVAAPQPNASEAGAQGSFLISRTGSTANPTAFSYVLTGFATNGADYQTLPLTGTIPAGQSSLSIPVIPIDDDLIEGDETVILTLSEGLGYTLGANTSTTVTIADNDTFTFAMWAAAFQIGSTDFDGDPDGDGVPNLVEYAIGTSPRSANPPESLRLVIEHGHAVLEVTRSWKPADVQLSVEVSDTMNPGSWQSGAPHTTVLADITNSFRVRDNSPAAGKRTRFLRLKATKL